MSRRSGITAAADAARGDEASARSASFADALDRLVDDLGVDSTVGSKIRDSFQNFLLQLGAGTDNATFAGSTYGFNPITRQRTLLEWIHRGSWLGGVAVDLVADDMTRAGVDITSPLPPADEEELNATFVRLGVWNGINDTVKWSRLYGGAIGVIMVDGQNFSTPLRPETVGRGAFRGVLALDRWMVDPTVSPRETIQELGPDIGMPAWYRVTGLSSALRGQKVHHSRCIRLEGIRLPYWQRVMENMWGISVLERLYDRMIAFDSATTGAAQLVHKSAIRTFKIKDLRNIAGTNDQEIMGGFIRYTDMMRRFQGIEQMTMIDADDEFEMNTSASFTGIAEALVQFGQQLAGALQIPLVRLFGMSPAGFSATGESDLRTYYDGIKQRQEKDLRAGLTTVYRVAAASERIDLGDSFGFEFRPLWQLTEPEKATVASGLTSSILAAEEAAVITKQQALREMRQMSRRTDVWTTITEEDVEDAEDEPPGVESLGLGGGEGSVPPSGPEPTEEGRGEVPPMTPPGRQANEAQDARRGRLHLHVVDESKILDFQGIPIYVETPKGEMRRGNGWECVMPADYGFVRLTGSAEGPTEGMDVFVGPMRISPTVWVVDQVHPDDGEFDEHKCMLGFVSRKAAIDAYIAAFSDGSGRERIGGVRKMSVDEFKRWLVAGGWSSPVRSAA